MMLAQKYNQEDPSGWWLSEKFDGVRALWTGEILVSRNGYKIFAPVWFTEGLPQNVRLDGELWLGRGRFQEMANIMRNTIPDAEAWRDVKFQVFDVVNEEPFEARLEHLTQLTLPEHVCVVEYWRCEGREHLERVYCSLVDNGAEGVMLRAPGSLFERRRSSNLLKIKKIDSSEAIIIDYLAGKGKNAKRLGSFVCRLANGIKFRVGSGISESMRDNPIEIGSVITFNHSGLTKAGIPRMPVFVAARNYE